MFAAVIDQPANEAGALARPTFWRAPGLWVRFRIPEPLRVVFWRVQLYQLLGLALAVLLCALLPGLLLEQVHGLFALVLVWGFSIALRSQHHFGRLVALGVTAMMFLYVFINTAMVMGLLPVVGVPLPLVSNGGTAMVSVMFACGLLIGVSVYRDAQLPRKR